MRQTRSISAKTLSSNRSDDHHTTSIVNDLQGLGLDVQPWIYTMGRDLHAWVTLNAPRPLTCIVPNVCQREVGRRFGNGQLEWEWSVNVDYEDTSRPWRGYIPLRNDWVECGTQGWLFERQDLHRIIGKASAPGLFCIVEGRRRNIELTYRAVEFMCITVCRMYEVNLPSDLHPPLCVG
jgi:hypothetical protein